MWHRGVRWMIVRWVERVVIGVIGIRVVATNGVHVRGAGSLWSQWFLGFLRNSLRFLFDRCLGHWRCSGCRIERYLKIILRIVNTCWRIGWLGSGRSSSSGSSIFFGCKGWSWSHYRVVEWHIGVIHTRWILRRTGR